jgi:CHAT domain-containing protein
MLSQVKSRMRSVLASSCVALIVAASALVHCSTDGARFIAPALAAKKDPLQADVAKFVALYQARNYEAASVMAPALLDALRARTGEDNPTFIQILSYVVKCYGYTRRTAQEEPLLKLAIPIVEKNLGPDNIYLGRMLVRLSGIYRDLGRYSESEPLLKRGLAIAEKVSPDQPDLDHALNELGILYNTTGRYADVESAYRRALALEEKRLGPDSPELGSALHNLAALYTDLGRYAEADGLLARAQTVVEQPIVLKKGEIREIAVRNRNADIAINLTGRGDLSVAMGRDAEAEPYYQRALAIAATMRDPDLASTVLIQDLAELYLKQGRYAEAEPLFKRALAIDENAFGSNTYYRVVEILDGLGTTYRHLGRDAEAEASYARALEIGPKVLGERHIDVGNVLRDLAAFKLATGHAAHALYFARKGVTVATSLVKDSANGVGLPTQSLRSHFEVALDVLRQAQADKIVGAEGASEAFEVAQWMNQSTAAAALNQMAARFSTGSDALAALVREQQDVVVERRSLDKSLVAEVSKPPSERNAAREQALRERMSDLDQRLKQLNQRLAAEFPDYAALTSPQPLAAADVQKLLSGDEALVFLLSGEKATQVFAVTRGDLVWQTVAMSADDLTRKVAAFRHGLDVDALHRGLERRECTQAEADKRGLSRIECGQALAKECEEAEKRGLARPDCATAQGRRELFDLGLAHELYGTLLGPVEPLIKDKRHLIVVPSGALTALPFHLLVTEKPAVAVPQVNAPRDLSAYRDAAWLLKRHAVSVLPSVASLKALRVFARKEQGAKPLVGFGDPVFNAEEEGRSGAEHQRTVVATRSYTEFWKGVEIDRSMLSKALPRLPETAAELRAVAKNLGAPESGLHLRQDASETTVKRAALADYRVVYFATHGLVAGEVKGLAEPSLALTLPKQPSDFDDGLLTASEVAQLKLNADWVVLSACNTIAGDKPGAEALSGLARAFFYAGAHALLVSHWAVESNAAMRLTTSTFDILKSDPSLGRAEALRRAMFAYLNDPANPLNAYPALWAPFVVVGEGAGR